MAHRLQFTGNLLLVEVSGTLDRRALDAIFNDFAGFMSGLSHAPDLLTDISGVDELPVHGDDIRSIFARCARIASPSNPFRHALVGATPLQFGVARMFQMLNPSSRAEVEVFSTREGAHSWLRSFRSIESSGSGFEVRARGLG
jgi:hypothetical protein